jgi:transposase
VSYDAGVTLEEYARRGKDNDFPELERCPCCKGVVRMDKHGFYWRNALEREVELKIPIRRLRCPSCRKTASLLPDFLLPYFQHTLRDVIAGIRRSLDGRVSTWRQRYQFCRKRFLRQLNQVEMFFRAEGFREMLPGDTREKAIKLMQMILALSEATFVRRSRGHFTTNFMAL